MEVLSDDGKVLEVREIQFHVLIFVLFTGSPSGFVQYSSLCDALTRF